MPEEINRIVTDSIADILWTPSPDGDENLIAEGVPKEKIKLVGNIMIDSLVMLKSKIAQLKVFEKFGCQKSVYGLVTLHRPSNVDNPDMLENLCKALKKISDKLPLIFPVHPRTKVCLTETGCLSILADAGAIHLTEPLGYKDFMNLVMFSKMLVTDSGGIQEETTYLGIPCFTLRENTERPITVKAGTNQLCSAENIFNKVETFLENGLSGNRIPELWDGKTAGRICDCINTIL
jgi:UDP-N-acetylglucosamine 2-epimerase (non-hydrolysing)